VKFNKDILALSLLAAGVKKVEGEFVAADIIKIKTARGEEFARGVVNFSSRELNRIKGVKSDEIKNILNRDVLLEEVIHRDNLVIL